MLLNISEAKKSVVDVDCGENVKICDFVNLYGCKIGDNTKIGTFVEIQRGAEVGSNCKISSHTFICEGVRIGNGVFVGHNVSFINDRNPRAVNEYGKMITNEWSLEKIIVEDNVSIGTSATIMGNVLLGRGSVVGAGAVVLEDVPPGVTVVGNPAHII